MPRQPERMFFPYPRPSNEPPPPVDFPTHPNSIFLNTFFLLFHNFLVRAFLVDLTKKGSG